MNTVTQNTEPGFGLDNSVIVKMRNIFAGVPSVEEAIIYGSRAKGDYRPGSDIDLTIKGANVTWQDLQRIERKMDDLLLPYKMDLSLYEQIDNKNLLDHINRVGKVFYTKVENDDITRHPG